MNARSAPLLVAALLALAACDDGKDDAPESPDDQAAPTATSAAAIPVEADYEEAAQKEVTADTLEAQVDALEKEIAADSAP